MITVLSFYKLQKIKKLKNLKNLLFQKINYLSIKGLIILSPEGINGTLAGKESKELPVVARPALVERVQAERSNDIKRDESQRINSSIDSFQLVSQTPKRIEVKVKLSYNDQRIKSTGEIVSETSIPSLKVTYILGREKDLWQLVDYISGS